LWASWVGIHYSTRNVILYVVSLYHKTSDSNSSVLGDIDWTNGTGYIEKDWGSSFPKCWIWIHTNNFDSDKPASLMASIAHIPWLGSYFIGFIVVLWIDGKEYRFATYNGSKMKCSVDTDSVTVGFKRKNFELDIKAIRGSTAELRSPILGRMEGKINESLQANVNVSLNIHGQVSWSAHGTTCGLEVAGDTSILETSTWKS
jgi:hypothetical protein